MRRVLVIVAAIAAVVPSNAALAATQWRFSGVSRIVAVGDVHGAYRQLVGLLEKTGIVDDSLHWSGGDTTFVSVGDLLDRGPASRKVLDLLMRLQSEAPASGGAVHVVMGDHEAMNLVGDLRYATTAQYAEFAADEPQSMRDTAFARFVKREKQPVPEARAKKVFDKRYPPGYFARHRAFLPSGRYGKWLLSLPAIIVVDDTAFMHGGLSERFAKTPPGKLDARIDADLRRYLALRARLAAAGVLPEADMQRDLSLADNALRRLDRHSKPALTAQLKEFIRLGEAPELGVEGPLWYRGAVFCKAILARPELEDALHGLGVSRIVIGHTPTQDRRIRSWDDGKLVMIDTGMLTQYFHGHPSALIIEHGKLSVRYLDGGKATVPERGRFEPYGLGKQQLLNALAKGHAMLAGGRARSATPATIEYDGKKIAAMFYPTTRRGSAQHELAAYRLDSLLGFDLVPPSVERRIGRVDGTMQLRYRDEISESQRLRRKLPTGEWCPIEPQLPLMYAFDLLTENTGRTRDNIAYREQRSNLILTDNGATFGTDFKLPRVPAGLFKLSPAAARALASLNEAQLDSALGRWLDQRQIAALLARRDDLLTQFGPAARAARAH